MTYEIAPSLNWTIFNGGQLVNATRLAKAQLDEAINQFNQTVLTAVQETDNAMNSYRNSIKQIVALREVRNQGIETLKLSLELYKQGLSPFQNVLFFSLQPVNIGSARNIYISFFISVRLYIL